MKGHVLIMKPLTYKALKVLVIGCGSIGHRHHAIIQGMGATVKTLSRRQNVGDFQNLGQALEEKFDLIVIANETSLHLETLCQIQEHDFQGNIFVEKPLAISTQDISVIRHPNRIWVGYNLRFHPAVLKLKTLLKSQKKLPYYAYFHAGQALSTWRQGRNHLETYSAVKHLGGGVLSDLSHEIDLAHWLFGSWLSVKSSVKKCSNQTLDSEDLAVILAQSEQGPLVTININYLDVLPIRFIQLSIENQNIKVNLVESTIDNNNELEKFSDGMIESYKNMWHEMLAVCNGAPRHSLCNFSEGRHVLQSIEDIRSNMIEEKKLNL